MKVLLINPPNYHVATSSSKWNMEVDNIGLYPPTGLMYIAAYMRENTDYEIRILDTLVDRLEYKEIEEYVRGYAPNLVGITSFTLTFYDVMETVKAVRRACPETHICVGGPHTFLWNEETARKPEVDSVVVGEGEITFTRLATALDSGLDLKSVRGLVLKDHGEIVRTPEGEHVKNLDELPFPAFDLVPYERYYSLWAKEKAIGVVFSSRGCPYRCTYCDKVNYKYRRRSINNVLDEIQLYYDRGVREVVFFDDLFNIIPQRVVEASNGILDRGLKIHWTFRGRVDHVTEEMVVTAKRAGCTLISLGVEDSTDEGLELINKKVTTEQVLKAVRTAKKNGIETSTNWIIGLPRHKSRRDVLQLLDFAKRVDATYAEFTILVPYYGTELFQQGIERGVLKEGLWEEFVRDPKPDFLLPMWEEHLTRDELSKLYHQCYKGYYYRPEYILKSLLRLRGFRELYKKAFGALKLLGITSASEGSHIRPRRQTAVDQAPKP